MSDDRQETVDDIVTAMRKDAELCHDAFLNDPNENFQGESVSAFLNEYARRIEAALKWERAEIEADGIAKGINGHAEVCLKHGYYEDRHVGNAAAMREALVKIREKCVIYNNDLAEEIDALCGNALAAPPRNCDLYKTARDAEDAFDDFCIWARIGHCEPAKCTLPKDHGAGSCFTAWLFAPASERKGEGDGR